MYIKVADILARLPAKPREFLERLVDSVEAYGYHGFLGDKNEPNLVENAEALAQWIEACHRDHIKAQKERIVAQLQKERTVTQLWYSIHGGGDGSVYPVLMESKVLCEIDQEFEGGGEPCYGCFTIESTGPINVKSEVRTVWSEIAEVEAYLAQEYVQEYKRLGKYAGMIARWEDRLVALKELQAASERVVA